MCVCVCVCVCVYEKEKERERERERWPTCVPCLIVTICAHVQMPPVMTVAALTVAASQLDAYETHELSLAPLALHEPSIKNAMFARYCPGNISFIAIL